MADQASLRGGSVQANGNGSRSNGVLGSLTEFGNDVATLAELQAKLAALDFQESSARAKLPLGLLAGGLALLTASLPVLLLGAAALLAEALHIREGWASLIVGGAALATAVALVAVGAPRLSASFESFRRSREELTRNLSWMRTVLLYSGRSVPRRDA